MAKKIGIILGSTRPGRISPSIASWVESTLADNADVETTIIDLKEENLPFFDEPTSPSVAPGTSEVAKAWSAKISSFDGFLILNAEYNAGYSAVLKNAIDYLKAEWTNRPIGIVGYGFSGAASATKQLEQVFERLGAVVLNPAIAIMIGEHINETGAIDEPIEKLSVHNDELTAFANQIVNYTPSVEA